MIRRGRNKILPPCLHETMENPCSIETMPNWNVPKPLIEAYRHRIVEEEDRRQPKRVFGNPTPPGGG